MEVLGRASDANGARFPLYFLDDHKGRRAWILGPLCPALAGPQSLELVAEFPCRDAAHARELVRQECARRGWTVGWS